MRFRLLAALGTGLVIGAWQGFWVAFVGIPAFIVTLAGMLVFRGLTQIVLENQRITGFPPEYRQLGGGSLGLGHGGLRPGLQWMMKRQKLSPRATTHWDELALVRAG